MYLEKLKIQGFKSFAGKYTLAFPGKISKDKYGITAIVGPNGSGKSNTADAIRWVLGEQSMKTLRGKKGEDVIFAGSDKKGKLGMAEVSLYLNNKDRQGDIDYSEIVLTRRLYRNGDSEYILNNSRTRLSDIQMLLAKANFGQRTYSVVGQGTVEGFLNTTLAERKEFFDEATGVKQFQIKRDDSLNKLRASYENLDQANMLLIEIEPRLKSLTRQVNKLKKRGELEAELKNLQITYYSKIWHELRNKFNKFNKEFLETEQEKRVKEKKMEIFNRELEKIKENSKDNNNYEEWQAQLVNLQREKDEMVRAIARLDAQLENKLESQGQFDLSWLNSKKEGLHKEIILISEEIDSLSEKIKHDTFLNSEKEKENKAVSQKLLELNNSVITLKNKLNSSEKVDVDKVLSNYIQRLESLAGENDIASLKQAISEIKSELKKVLEQLEGEEEKEQIADMQNNIIKFTQGREEIIIKINENKLRISARSERVKLLQEKKQQLQNEFDNIENKLRQNQDKFDLGEINQAKDEQNKKLIEINNQINSKRQKLEELKFQEEQERSKLFSIQKNIQILQNEINILSNKLSEAKAGSARYETKLEDLEIEIRYNLKSLKEIKENANLNSEEEIDISASFERINNLRRQLELIGGIEPEIEKEYIDTKERYDFLFAQSSDLTNAINSLEKIIIDLDGSIKEKFDKEFKIIADKFQEYFKILFNGGKAKIVKVMEEEKKAAEAADAGQAGEEQVETEIEKTIGARPKNIDLKRIKFLKKHNATGLAGIEIQANPPGKKIQILSMLSGGERALTTIALICAIISANPSPFVVLDEVDAALDEANSERLAKILEDLSHKTQFIVITHNRASMRRANVLYGVSMQDDGISKLLSVKLEDINYARQ